MKIHSGPPQGVPPGHDAEKPGKGPWEKNFDSILNEQGLLEEDDASTASEAPREPERPEKQEVAEEQTQEIHKAEPSTSKKKVEKQTSDSGNSQAETANKAKGMKDQSIKNVKQGASEDAQELTQPAASKQGRGEATGFGKLLKPEHPKHPFGGPPGKKGEAFPTGIAEGLRSKKAGKDAEEQSTETSHEQPSDLPGKEMPLSAYFPEDAKVADVKPAATGDLQIPHIERIVDRILAGVNASGDPEVKVDLHLPDLGQLNVNVTRADAGLIIQINAENEKAGLQLSQNMQALYSALVEKTLQISNIQIMVQNQPVPLSELLDSMRNADSRVQRKDSSGKTSGERDKKQGQSPAQGTTKGA